MKRTLLLMLILVLLLPTAACASIEGEGWFDPNFDGNWMYLDDSDLLFRLPEDWSDDIVDLPGDHIYWQDDYCVCLSVHALKGSLWDIADQLEDNGLVLDEIRYDEYAYITMNDLDWFIMSNENHLCGITTGMDNVAYRFDFQFDDNIEHFRTLARRILSTVQGL